MKQFMNWFRRRTLENSLDRELQYHWDRRISDLMQSGLSEERARRKATLEFGGLTQVRETVRDVWLSRWLRDLAYDLRFSARSFLRTPLFTTTAVLSMALGIGAATAIYSLVDQVVLHALPVRQPERLVLLDWNGDQAANGFGSYNLMSYPICQDLQEKTNFFDGVFCRAFTDVNLSAGGDGKPVTAELVSGSYFTVLGVQPLLGNLWGREVDGGPNTHPVIVLSYGFWKTQLGGDPRVVGRKVLVNQHPVSVVAVASPSFQGVDVGRVPAFWMPASMSSFAIPGFNSLLDRRTRWMQILGHLAPGVTLKSAQAGLQPWFKSMLKEDLNRAGFPIVTAERRQRFLNSTLTLTPAPQGHSGLRRRIAQPLWVLFAATAVLLCLACLNVSGLFLARGSARDRELSTRLALGATRGRVGRQLLADGLLISLVGGIFGTALAPLAVRALVAFLAFLPSGTTVNALHASVDVRVLLFALSVSVAAGILSGLAPALQAGRRSIISSLRERGGTASSGARLRKLIVTAQIAFTLILVIAAVLFVRTLSSLMAKGPGFTTSHLVFFGLDPLQNGYPRDSAMRLMKKLNEAIAHAPITETSAVARFAFLTGGSWNDPITIQSAERFTTDRDVNLNAVSPSFFRTMGVSLLAGRNFDERDSRPPGQTVERFAIVNEAFAKRYVKNRSPLGARIAEGNGPDVKPVTEIIGVVPDFSYRGIREESEQAYYSYLESEVTGGVFYVKVRGTPEAALRSLRDIVRNADPSLPITNFRTVDEQVDRSLNTERLLASLSASFGALALLLSLVGLYGVMSFVVTQRTREIGIRLALGAKRRSTVWLVLSDALWMIAGGLAIGLPFIWALGRLVESQLYNVKPTDVSVVAIAATILCTAAVGASLIPAHRASAVNPTDALRAE